MKKQLITATELKRLRNELARLRGWIKDEGERSNICTYWMLGKTVCGNCNCDRSKKKSV